MTVRPALLLVLASTLILNAGCRPENEGGTVKNGKDPAAKPIPLRVLVVEDGPLAAAIDREWKARSEGVLLLQQKTSDELLASEEGRLGADVILYPSGLLGELAMREWLSPVASTDPQVAQRDVLPLLRRQEAVWGEQTYAFSFGSPTFCLVYRPDLLEAHGLNVPTTWEAYQALAQILGEKLGSENGGATTASVAEPLADGWAGQVLLARAAAYARHRSQFSTLFDARTMEPLIAGPPFVRALEELVAASKLSLADSKLTPAETYEAVRSGKVALAVTWPHREESAPAAQADSSTPVGFAELPGAKQVFNFRTTQWETRADDEETRVTLLGISGRLGSITRECRNPGAAANLLAWLTADELGQETSIESRHTAPFRTSQLATAGAWLPTDLDAEATRQFAETLEDALSRNTGMCSVRIPGRSAYLEALDTAVQQAVAGEKTPTEALVEAAQKWHDVTTTRGLEPQQTAYRKSIGLAP